VGGVIVEDFGHAFGKSDAAVGCWISWEESGVHADGAVETEEIGHWSVDEDFARTGFVFAGVGVVINDLSSRAVFDDPVERG